MTEKPSVADAVKRLAAMSVDDPWVSRFYGALEALSEVIGQPLVAEPLPPHVVMARLIEHVARRLSQAEAASATPPAGIDVERWYAAFEKVSGQEAKTLDGKRIIFDAFAAAYGAPPPAGAGHKPGDFHDYRGIECATCGQRGTLNLSVEPQRYEAEIAWPKGAL